MIPTWKNLLLNAYYHGTLLPRLGWARWQESQGRAPLVMLYYHRIADDRANDWTISNAMFVRHIRFMQRHFDMISLEESQRRIRAGRNERLAVHITFDDGYHENCDHALPLLVREKIPFTYFVTSKNILERQPFPHDIWNQRPLQPNSLEQLKALAEAGVEIGGHTQTHANLGAISDPAVIYREVADSRHELEAALGVRIRYFAFPFGLHEHLNLEVFRIGQSIGYEAICSAYGGYNFPGGDAYHLQRFDASPIFIQLRNWLIFDPIKHLRVQPYDYQRTAATVDQDLISASTATNGQSR